MRQSTRAAIIVLTCLIFLPSAGRAIDLREAANKISFSDKAAAFGMNSGNLIILDGDSVVGYNKRLKPVLNLSLKRGQQLSFSENGLYYGLISSYVAENSVGDSLYRIDIHNDRDSLKWSADGLVKGNCHIAPSGDYVVFAAGTVGAYNWQIIICHANQTATLLDLEAFKDVKFAADGSRFLIDGGPKGVRLYDKTGRLLKALDYQNSYVISPTGKYFAVFKDGTLSIYRDTTLLSENKEVDREIVAAKINEKLKRLYYVAAFDLVVIDLERGVRVWDYKPESAQYRFTSLDLSANDQFLACGVIINLGARIPKEKRHPKGYIYMFDIGRNIMRKAEFRNSGWNEGQPEVGFWPDQRTILVRTYDRILTFEMI